MRAIIAKDLIAVRRSKAVVHPDAGRCPALLMIVLPLGDRPGGRGRQQNPDVGRILEHDARATSPHRSSTCPTDEQLVVLVQRLPAGAAVPHRAADGVGRARRRRLRGEKERKTLESLLHLPIADRDLFLAKLLTAFIPAMAVSWVGFLCFCVVANGVAWPVLHRVFVPTQLWLVMILWVAPGGRRARPRR